MVVFFGSNTSTCVKLCVYCVQKTQFVKKTNSSRQLLPERDKESRNCTEENTILLMEKEGRTKELFRCVKFIDV